MCVHNTAVSACFQGRTALYEAAIEGRADMVVLLLANGADVDSTCKDKCSTNVSTLLMTRHSCHQAVTMFGMHQSMVVKLLYSACF